MARAFPQRDSAPAPRRVCPQAPRRSGRVSPCRTARCTAKSRSRGRNISAPSSWAEHRQRRLFGRDCGAGRKRVEPIRKRAQEDDAVYAMIVVKRADAVHQLRLAGLARQRGETHADTERAAGAPATARSYAGSLSRSPTRTIASVGITPLALSLAVSSAVLLSISAATGAPFKIRQLMWRTQIII